MGRINRFLRIWNGLTKSELCLSSSRNQIKSKTSACVRPCIIFGSIGVTPMMLWKASWAKTRGKNMNNFIFLDVATRKQVEIRLTLFQLNFNLILTWFLPKYALKMQNAQKPDSYKNLSSELCVMQNFSPRRISVEIWNMLLFRLSMLCLIAVIFADLHQQATKLTSDDGRFEKVFISPPTFWDSSKIYESKPRTISFLDRILNLQIGRFFGWTSESWRKICWRSNLNTSLSTLSIYLFFQKYKVQKPKFLTNRFNRNVTLFF